ncbi:MAG TPA: OB-fold nucleic acid binding domain-containing protein, partial [Isosphaeraceae bacterium]|nr:OB-fold nucleic acid binding domain-containing protein [Isosphaeraceae bacterium]
MTRRYVNQLANSDSVEEVFLVADKQLRANRQGNLYLHLELRDKSGVVGARMWNATEALASRFEPGDYLLARGKVQVFQGALQIILAGIEVVDSNRIDPLEFLPRSASDAGKLTARLREVLMGMSNPNLRALAECFLIDDAFLRKYTTAPAGIKNHHAYQAGLLEHVVSMMNVTVRIADLYPDLDRDLLLMGIFLHDVGKIDELSYTRAFAYTDEGQLVGHLVMGVT